MHLFATSGEDEEGLRSRILSYLSDGPVAGILHELATTELIDVREVTRLLDTAPAEDPREWLGAAARQLEAYPDQPVLLLVRGMAEAMLDQPDLAVVSKHRSRERLAPPRTTAWVGTVRLGSWPGRWNSCVLSGGARAGHQFLCSIALGPTPDSLTIFSKVSNPELSSWRARDGSTQANWNSY